MNNHILFMQSGCLTEDTMLQYVRNELSIGELEQVNAHLSECDLCKDAILGLEQWEQDNSKHDASSKVQDDFIQRISSIKNKVSNRAVFHHKPTFQVKRNRFKIPLYWQTAAALLILFIGIFYIVRLQQVYEKNKTKSEFAQETPNQKSIIAVDTPMVASNIAPSPSPKPKTKHTQNQLAFATQKEKESEPNPNHITSDLEVVQDKRMDKTNHAISPAIATNEVQEDCIFVVVEQAPEFVGGQQKMKEFIAQHLIYPDTAKETGIEGTVYVSFVIDIHGKPTNIEVLRGIGGGCDEEAIRVIGLMPAWNPAKQSGKKVASQITIPIKFSLMK